MRSKLSEYLTRIIFIVSVFLYEAGDLMLLFSLPVFIFLSTRSIILTSLIMLLRPLGMAVSFLLFKYRLQERNFVFLMLIAYSLSFLVVILFNRMLSFSTLVLAVFLLGMAKQLMTLGTLKVEYEKTGLILGSVKRFLQPAIVLAAVSITLVIGDLTMEYQFHNLQNYFSLLLSTSAVTFYYFICKKFSLEKQKILFPKATKFLLGFTELDPKIVLIEAVKGVMYILFPIFISANISDSPDLMYVIPAFFFPIMILHILRNSRMFKYWKVRSLPILLIISIVLSLFMLVSEDIHLVILSGLLGSSVGLIEVSSSYKKEKGEAYVNNLRSVNLGFLLGALLGGVANTYFTLPVMFSTLGICLLIYIFIKKIFPLQIEIKSS